MYLIVRSRPIRTTIDHSQPMKSLLIIIAVLTHQFLYEKTEKKIFFVRLQTVSVYACHIYVCDVIGEILLLVNGM